jgi:bifunctional non-homologous end joining protein LigD
MPIPVRPMLAMLSSDAPLQTNGWVYEPKYDGIRAIVELDQRGRATLWSRLGNEKTSQFPEITRALEQLARTLKRRVVADGEIVALDRDGNAIGFQNLQGRIHLKGERDIDRALDSAPVALIVFDLLIDGSDDLRGHPLDDRRRRLETLSKEFPAPLVRLSEQVRDDGRALMDRATHGGWEGLIAKDARSTYQTGKRSPSWLKLKLLKRQEFVVVGWTEPRQTRSYFGALLLGAHDNEGRLQYVGHTGTGFDEKELARVYALLRAREIRTSPFSERIKTNEPAHWTKPELVAEVKFTEWTAEGRLRHPVYLGLRDDKKAEEVKIEGSRESQRSGSSRSPSRGGDTKTRVTRVNQGNLVNQETFGNLDSIISQLSTLESSRRDGTVMLPSGDKVGVTSLNKVFWPQGKITKGELMRYYVAASPYLLPAIADRPLVMKRFPNGVGGKAFYQQRAREERPPAGVRIEQLPPELDPISIDDAKRFVGGSLTTLLYMTQLAAISQDPWFSRVQSPLDADYCAIDLDPGDDTPFSRVVEVARAVGDALDRLRVPGYPKTSGSSGLHVYIPLPPHTSYESGLLFCQVIAALVTSRLPKIATTERAVKARPRGTVYVDCLQNILGKTLATAYSARASEFAGVSMPLAWDEVRAGVDPRDFTIRTALARFKERGDLWAGLREETPADLAEVLERYSASPARSSSFRRTRRR